MADHTKLPLDAIFVMLPGGITLVNGPEIKKLAEMDNGGMQSFYAYFIRELGLMMERGELAKVQPRDFVIMRKQ